MAASKETSLPRRYEPWKGDRFDNQDFWAKRKVLILGESHHFKDADDDVPSATTDRVWEAVKDTRPYLYFKRIPEILRGRKLSSTERADTWQTVAFYNIVQEPAGPNRMPKSEAFQRSLPALYELLEEYSPTHVLFVSLRAWNGTPLQCISSEAVPVSWRRKPFELWCARPRGLARPHFWTTYVLHPTGARPPPSVEQSHEVFHRLIDKPAPAF